MASEDETTKVNLEVNDPNGVLSLLKTKDGWKTTEFWIAVAMTLVGVWLVERGQDTIGAALVALAGTGYKVSRTAVKRVMRVSVLLLALLLGGCHGQCLTPENVGPSMVDVLDRHDAYVHQNETRLTEVEQEVYLNTSAMLRKVLHESGYVDPDGRAYYVEPGH
jgi:hypothetical protein